MTKNIEPHLRSISEYLTLKGETIFSIPQYQRQYSWEKEQCDKLWSDITDYIENESEDRYFFGTIIINCQENDRLFSLIDGQQRTTTFLILLKALLINVNRAIVNTRNDDESESLYRGLKQRRRDIMKILYKAEEEIIEEEPNKVKDVAIYNSQSLINNLSINESYKDELQKILASIDYHDAESKVTRIPKKQLDNKYTNYFRNFKFFVKKAEELSDSKLNAFTKSFLSRCEVIEIKSWQVEQAITMFNSLNSDGLALNDADIISAQLYASAKSNDVSNEFHSLWEELKQKIEYLKPLAIDIDAILMQQMYYQRAVDGEIIKVKGGSPDVTMPGLRRYYTDINKKLLEDPVNLCRQLINLTEIWIKVTSYPVVQVLLKFNANAKVFLSGFFHRFKSTDIEKPETEAAIKGIAESFLKLFAALELGDVGFSSKYFKTFLFRELVKMADVDIHVNEIQNDFIEHLIHDDYSTNQPLKPEYITDSILSYDKNILVYLNEYLFAKNNSYSFELDSKCEIEHIMPQSGKDINTIKADALITSKEEFMEVVNKIGNKIILEKQINASLGNKWFRTKVSTKLSEKTGYKDSAYPIAKALVKTYETADKPFWDKHDIEKATLKASERIVNFIFNR